VMLLELLAQGLERVMQPRSSCAVWYAKLAGDRRHGAAPVEGLYEHGLVRGRQVLERGGNELPVQDLLHTRIGPDLAGRLPRHGYRPGPRRPVRVDHQVARDPVQPGPDRAVISAQPGQVTPGTDEGLLHDVFRARRVRAELLDVAAQGPGIERVQLADDGIGVAVQAVSRDISDSEHIY